MPSHDFIPIWSGVLTRLVSACVDFTSALFSGDIVVIDSIVDDGVVDITLGEDAVDSNTAIADFDAAAIIRSQKRVFGSKFQGWFSQSAFEGLSRECGSVCASCTVVLCIITSLYCRHHSPS